MVRTRAFFSLVNNLCPVFLQQVFPNQRLRQNCAELSSGTWETNCAEGDSESIWEDCSELLVQSWRGAPGSAAKAGVLVGNPQEKLLHPRGSCKTGPADRVVWCSSEKALKWLLLPGVPWLGASFRKDYCLELLHQGCL